MKKIKFIHTLATARQCFVTGNVYEVADPEATEFVAKELAVTVEPAPVVEVPKVAPASKVAAAAKPEPKNEPAPTKASK